MAKRFRAACADKWVSWPIGGRLVLLQSNEEALGLHHLVFHWVLQRWHEQKYMINIIFDNCGKLCRNYTATSHILSSEGSIMVPCWQKLLYLKMIFQGWRKQTRAKKKKSKPHAIYHENRRIHILIQHSSCLQIVTQLVCKCSLHFCFGNCFNC